MFSSRPVDPAERQASLPSTLATHTVTQEQVDGLDPLTYAVVRHRLWSVTDETGEALKRMSGSPIVTDANDFDFDFAISDEIGQEVQVGLDNTMLVGAVDLAIHWTLRHRAANPGIAEGDMFLTKDPWVGGGLHQNDTMVFQPVFHDGELFAWTSAICHEPDLGGVGLGSFSPAAQDVFSESLPTPPVKVVRGFQLQRDVADLWVRRSPVPMLVGLDLRAKVGANNVGRERILALIAQYGADTVKAVMKQMMGDAETRLRGQMARDHDGIDVRPAHLYPGRGTAPICWRKVSVSHTSQVSAIFPPTTLWIEIASTRIALPVGGMPFTSPTWVPVPVHRTITRSPEDRISSIAQCPSAPSW